MTGSLFDMLVEKFWIEAKQSCCLHTVSRTTQWLHKKKNASKPTNMRSQSDCPSVTFFTTATVSSTTFDVKTPNIVLDKWLLCQLQGHQALTRQDKTRSLQVAIGPQEIQSAGETASGGGNWASCDASGHGGTLGEHRCASSRPLGSLEKSTSLRGLHVGRNKAPRVNQWRDDANWRLHAQAEKQSRWQHD